MLCSRHPAADQSWSVEIWHSRAEKSSPSQRATYPRPASAVQRRACHGQHVGHGRRSRYRVQLCTPSVSIHPRPSSYASASARYGIEDGWRLACSACPSVAAPVMIWPAATPLSDPCRAASPLDSLSASRLAQLQQHQRRFNARQCEHTYSTRTGHCLVASANPASILSILLYHPALPPGHAQDKDTAVRSRPLQSTSPTFSPVMTPAARRDY
jgi:hypothetical protein